MSLSLTVVIGSYLCFSLLHLNSQPGPPWLQCLPWLIPLWPQHELNFASGSTWPGGVQPCCLSVYRSHSSPFYPLTNSLTQFSVFLTVQLSVTLGLFMCLSVSWLILAQPCHLASSYLFVRPWLRYHFSPPSLCLHPRTPAMSWSTRTPSWDPDCWPDCMLWAGSVQSEAQRVLGNTCWMGQKGEWMNGCCHQVHKPIFDCWFWESW